MTTKKITITRTKETIKQILADCYKNSLGDAWEKFTEYCRVRWGIRPPELDIPAFGKFSEDFERSVNLVNEEQNREIGK